jgi:hypothetical protein
LEFGFSPFSGNGVFARSLVSGLLNHGGDDDDDDDDENDVRVRVVCARPHPSTPGISDDVDVCDVDVCDVVRRRRHHHRRADDDAPSSSPPPGDHNRDSDDDDDDDDARMRVWPVDLPERCAWNRLDRHGPWREYSSSLSSIAEKVGRFRPTDVVAVDWHGALAWEDIAERLCRSSSRNPPSDDADDDDADDADADGGVTLSSSSSSWHPRRDGVFVLYFNFRVYSSSEWGGGKPSSSSSGGGGGWGGWGGGGGGREGIHHDDDDDDDNAFYRDMERRACRAADAVVCLSENDRSALRALMRGGEEDGHGNKGDHERRDDNDGNDNYDDDDEHRRRRHHEREKDVHILRPPLRGDVRELATMAHRGDIDRDGENDECDDECGDGENDTAGGRRRSSSLDRFLPPEARSALETGDGGGSRRGSRRKRAFVTCVVRLSPEKSPRNFVALLGRLGGVGFLRAHGLVPLMCGARSVEDYAGEIVEELRRLVTVRSSTASHRWSSSSEDGDEEVGEDVVSDVDVDDDDGTWPCVVLDRHMGPAELAAIFSRTAINVHVSVAI